MKKIISLLMAVMLVMSAMSFSVMASSDTQLTVADGKPTEDELPDGTFTGTASNGVYYGKSGVTVAPISEGSTNKVFVINGSKTANNGSALVAFRARDMYDAKKSNFKRFTANIMLPTVDDTDAMVGVHMPGRAATVSSGRYNGFGVFLTNGGAQYWDSATSKLVYFIPQGTMQADKWYRVDAIMDTREATANVHVEYAKDENGEIIKNEKGENVVESATTDSVLYMNAFVYDADTNELVGSSGWQSVSNRTVDVVNKTKNTVSMDNGNYLYSAAHTGFYNVYIQAYKFPADDASVYVDSFNAYDINDPAEYELSVDVERSVLPNKYVEVDNDAIKESDGKANFHKTIGHVFNAGNNSAIIKDTSENKAARVEMSVRIPELVENGQLDFYRLYSNKAGKYMPTIDTDTSEGARVIEGTIQISGDELTVNAYDAQAGVYNTPVALNVGSSLEIAENEWYTFVWDMDYTDFENPKAMVYVKNDLGQVVAQTTAPYAIQPIPKNSYGQWLCVIILGTSALKTQNWHFDNTAIYTADTVANLANEEVRTTHINNTFESYEVGTNYHLEIVVNEYAGGAVNYPCETAKVAVPTFKWEEGMQVSTTDPLIFTYSFTKPMPVANLTTNNVEVYANGIKLNSGYTISYGTPDANNCVTSFSVNTGALNWDTDYIVRLKADVVDYNPALSGGIPAISGLYVDSTFSVMPINPDCTIDSYILNSEGAPYESETLTANDVIKASVSVTNNEDGQVTCYGILAIYDGVKLVDLKRTSLITVPAGETVTNDSITYTAAKDGLTAKLFVWNNFELMTPWTTPTILGK